MRVVPRESPRRGPPPSVTAPPPRARGQEVRIVIESDPSGADVFTPWGRLGRTPLVLARPRGEDFDVAVRRSGYRTVIRTVVADSDKEIDVVLQRGDDTQPAKKALANRKRSRTDELDCCCGYCSHEPVDCLVCPTF